MILLTTAQETQKTYQQTFKKQLRSFSYDFTKNATEKKATETAAGTQKHNQ